MVEPSSSSSAAAVVHAVLERRNGESFALVRQTVDRELERLVELELAAELATRSNGDARPLSAPRSMVEEVSEPRTPAPAPKARRATDARRACPTRYVAASCSSTAIRSPRHLRSSRPSSSTRRVRLRACTSSKGFELFSAASSAMLQYGAATVAVVVASGGDHADDGESPPDSGGSGGASGGDAGGGGNGGGGGGNGGG